MDWNEIPRPRGTPDFENLLAVLRREIPRRPTLFEFFMNNPLYLRLVPEVKNWPADYNQSYQVRLLAFTRLGYDYLTVCPPRFCLYESGARHKNKTVSMNQGPIQTRADFDAYVWADPDAADFDLLDRLGERLPPGMKLIAYGPGGVLENAVELVGFESLCVMVKEDPQLADDIFGEIGKRLVRFYQGSLEHASVGACLSNDDWGFKTQTMFSPRDMRRFVFPWHQRLVEVCHAAGRPVILHSCGHFERVMDDMVSGMKYDGRHSYEDAILPVEAAYDRYHRRIAILGGIDMDYICRSTPEEVYQRSRSMLERSTAEGSYAHGSGNSIPEYVPDANYFALIRAALDLR